MLFVSGAGFLEVGVVCRYSCIVLERRNVGMNLIFGCFFFVIFVIRFFVYLFIKFDDICKILYF